MSRFLVKAPDGRAAFVVVSGSGSEFAIDVELRDWSDAAGGTVGLHEGAKTYAAAYRRGMRLADRLLAEVPAKPTRRAPRPTRGS